jgi:hypothetical protein
MSNLFYDSSKFYEALENADSGTKTGLFFGDSWMAYVNIAQPSDLSICIAAAFKKALFLDMATFGMDTPGWSSNVSEVLELQSEFGFDVIALSIGGNDIIGKNMPKFLKKPNQPQDAGTHVWTPYGSVVNDYVHLAQFEQAIQGILLDIGMVVDNVKVNSPEAVVVVHTYDVPFASDIGWKLGKIKVGPWIRPNLEGVGLVDPADQRTLLSWLVKEFAAVLSSYVLSNPDMRIVNSIGTLPTQDLWANELHPSYDGFKKLVQKRWKPVLSKLL